MPENTARENVHEMTGEDLKALLGIPRDAHVIMVGDPSEKAKHKKACPCYSGSSPCRCDRLPTDAT